MNKSLEFRRRQISREKSALSFSAVRDYALRFRNHFLDFFSTGSKRTTQALNWKTLDFTARWNHVQKLVRHALSFGGRDYYNIEVKMAKNDAKSAGTLGAANAREVFIYEKLLESDDYDKVAEVCSHEPSHVFQLRGGDTTMSHSSVKNCYENYVQPGEDYASYRENPIEQEAWKIGQKVGEKFTETLRARQVNMATLQSNYYQNVI
jgi:hypothetical protein